WKQEPKTPIKKIPNSIFWNLGFFLFEFSGSYPHFEYPQLLHSRHPSEKMIPSGSPHSSHFLSAGAVPSGTNCFKARTTPAFQVLMFSSKRFRLLIRSTT